MVSWSVFWAQGYPRHEGYGALGLLIVLLRLRFADLQCSKGTFESLSQVSWCPGSLQPNGHALSQGRVHRNLSVVTYSASWMAEYCSGCSHFVLVLSREFI